MLTCTSLLFVFSQDSSFSDGKFGDIKDLVMDLLSTYNYEKVGINLLHICLDPVWKVTPVCDVTCRRCFTPASTSLTQTYTNNSHSSLPPSTVRSFHMRTRATHAQTPSTTPTPSPTSSASSQSSQQDSSHLRCNHLVCVYRKFGFRCGHSFHLSCLKRRQVPRVIRGETVWVCMTCSRSRMQQPTSRTHRSSSGAAFAADDQVSCIHLPKPSSLFHF